MQVDLMALGTRVRRARERAGHGQRELAEATGIPRAHLSRLEDGGRSRATLEQLNLLARILGVSLQHLLCGSTSSGPSSGETTVADSVRTLTHT
jgi:transcriptional regulator with XRE-family HTH domain